MSKANKTWEQLKALGKAVLKKALGVSKKKKKKKSKKTNPGAMDDNAMKRVRDWNKQIEQVK